MLDLARLQRCLQPATIAVVGGGEAERVVQQCQKLGYQGAIWPVNPQRTAIAGLPCYAELRALPAAPDATFIAIPADASIELIRQLAPTAAGGAVCYASGFREVGAPGAARQARLLAAAGDMPVFGPNCYGYINALCGAALWPDQQGLVARQSGVAIISASGNIGLNLSVQQRSVPIAQLITVGNQAIVRVEDCILAALENPQITAIGLHIEGLLDLARFVQAASLARAKKVPIVVLKVGQSDAGARITFSHTATLAGPAELYAALFDRLGIAQVSDLETFLEALKLLAYGGVLRGNRIAAMSCSGGEACLLADLAAPTGLQFARLSTEHKKQVQATLNTYVTVDNPLDYHTFIWGDAARMQRTFTAMLRGNFDLSVLVLDFPLPQLSAMPEWQQAMQAFSAAAADSGSRVAVLASLSENIPTAVRQALLAAGVVPLLGMRQGLNAIAAASYIGQCWQRAPQPPIFSHHPEYSLATSVNLDEAAAKARLKRAQVATPAAYVVDSPAAAATAAAQLGWPVVLKALGSELLHKTELGGVVLGLTTAAAVRAAATDLLKLADKLLVEQMIVDGVAELLLGVGYDELFGHYLSIGFGGNLVELQRDTAIVLLPASAELLQQALQQLKNARLLNGYRGRKKANQAAVVDTALRLAQLASEPSEGIIEVEINPLLVPAEPGQAVAADALMRVVQR